MKKILKLDSQFSVIDGTGIEILDTLPPGVYELKSAQMRGYWVEPLELEAFPGKVYGIQHEMEEKVLRRYFGTSGRNLGVMLSGEKGTGKSLFVRNLAVKISKDIPVIIVKRNGGPGMLSTLASIKGRAAIIFDEFEKMFRKESNNGNGNADRNEEDIREQESALSFFDGVETKQEKLLLLTVNDTWNVSKYLLGRPGRIHYHFRMAIPTCDEIIAYLSDNLKAELHGNIKAIASKMVSRAVSWDSLSAVVMELNSGETLDDTLRDLNIRTETSFYTKLMIKAVFSNGKECQRQIDVGEDETDINISVSVNVDPKEYGGVDSIWVPISFSTTDIEATGRIGEFMAADFFQGDAEDCEDKKVPNAPKVEKVLVYRKSTMNSIMSTQPRGLSYIL